MYHREKKEHLQVWLIILSTEKSQVQNFSETTKNKDFDVIYFMR